MSMSVQAELLHIGGEIIRRENPLLVPCKDGAGASRRWFNTERFRPGLCVLAMLQRPTDSSDGSFTFITFGLLHPELGNEVLTVVPNADPGVYENALGQYVLDQFRRQYVERDDWPRPIGVAGDPGRLTIFDPVHVLAVADGIGDA